MTNNVGNFIMTKKEKNDGALICIIIIGIVVAGGIVMFVSSCDDTIRPCKWNPTINATVTNVEYTFDTDWHWCGRYRKCEYNYTVMTYFINFQTSGSEVNCTVSLDERSDDYTKYMNVSNLLIEYIDNICKIPDRTSDLNELDYNTKHVIAGLVIIILTATFGLCVLCAMCIPDQTYDAKRSEPNRLNMTNISNPIYPRSSRNWGNYSV